MATRYPLIVNTNSNQIQEIPYGDTLDLSGNTVNQIIVSGISTLGSVKISSGIVTASSGIVTYYGDGSQLTGVTKPKTVLTDISSNGLTFYIGKALVGISTTQPYWTIKRTLTSVSGIVTSTGTATNVAWSDRTTSTYT